MRSVREYLQSYEEEIPLWLCEYKPEDKVRLQDVLSSRIAYYPGCGFDGNLITIANKAHCVHVYLYVDYGVSREQLEYHLADPHCINGYHAIGRVEFTPDDFKPISNRIPPFATEGHRSNMFRKDMTYCIMTIFERNEDKDNNWGAYRLALIYLCEDGILTYKYLFARGSLNAPWIFLLQDHGFGLNYDKFGKNGALDRIISSSSVRPLFVICGENTKIWDGYEKIDNLHPTFHPGTHCKRELYTLAYGNDTLLIRF